MNNSLFLKSIALLFLLSAAGVAEAEVYYKEIRKSVKVNSTVRLDMDIDYADVNIVTWDQGTIEIVVKQNVDSKSESRANEIFENMRVNVTESADLVGLEVSMGSYSCSGKTESYSIHVEIKMPAAGTVDGDISFGNIYISDLKGPFEAKVEYGNITAQNLLSGNNDLEVAFGNADIKNTNGGDFENQYGNLEIKKLNGSAEIKSAFGNLEIDLVSKEVKTLELDIQYGDADIELASDFSCSFNINSSYGDIDMPSEAKITKSESDYTNKSITGIIGSGGSNRLKINNDFGNVEIDIDEN
jgi:Putative adhesin